MRSPPAPAALPALAFLGAVVASRQGLAVPPALGVALLGGALALGARSGAAIAALSCGLILGTTSLREAPPGEAGRVTVAAGTICGVWTRGAIPGVASAPFCPDWMRTGGRLLTRPASGRIELASTQAQPPPGARVEATGTLARFPGFANESAVAPGGWRLRVKSAAHLRSLAEAPAWRRERERWRLALDRALAAAAPRGSAGLALVRGLVLGDVSEMDRETVAALRRSGLAHLLAVSGFNVAVLLAVAGAAAGRRRRLRRALVLVATIAGYLALVGAAPSLERASIMALAGVSVFVLRRPGSALQALALAALALVAAEPAAVSDTGFQLSFGATAGLLLLARRWTEAMRPLPRPLAGAIATTLAAQAGTLPASVGTFGALSPVAPLLNLVAIPWSAFWMLFALAWTLLAVAAPAAARVLAPALELAARPFTALRALPPSPWVAVWVSGGWLGGLAVAGLVALFLELPPRHRRWRLLGLLLVLGEGEPRRPATTIVFADVGQGDAALILGRRTSVLVDGGGLAGRDLGAQVLWPLVTARAGGRLDLVVLSHADNDHCAGLAALARYVRFDELWLPPQVATSRCVDELAARSGARVDRPRAGRRFERGDLSLTVLHPAPGDRPADDNAASLVLRLDADGRSVLFTGDIGGATERALARRAGDALAADLLKVPHHGSATSTSAELLAAAGASWAIVSAGPRNPFGHPASEVLARLRSAGVRVVRTDRQGAAVFSWREGEPVRLALPGSPRAAPEDG